MVDVSGLTPDTEYALRVRIRNEWGVDTYIELPSAYTRAVPFATTGLGWTFSPDGSTVDVTFGVSSIYDNAMGSATLYYGESADPTASQGERPVNTAGDLSWQGLPVSASTMYAKVVLSATLNGQTYSQTNEAPIVSGSTAVSVSDIMEHASAATAVRDAVPRSVDGRLLHGRGGLRRGPRCRRSRGDADHGFRPEPRHVLRPAPAHPQRLGRGHVRRAAGRRHA